MHVYIHGPNGLALRQAVPARLFGWINRFQLVQAFDISLGAA